MKEWLKALPIPVKIAGGIVTVLLLWWIVASGFSAITSTLTEIKDNYKDRQMQSQVDKLEADKKANQKVIELLQADNIKLKAEREAMDKEVKLIKEAIANDGKIISSEQKKIDEATKNYNETKDSCSGAGDTDAYVQCVCAKLGVDCN